MPLTSTQLAEKVGVPTNYISWLIQRTGCKPINKVGKAHLYDESAVEQIQTFQREHGRKKMEKTDAHAGLYSVSQLAEKCGVTEATIRYTLRALQITPTEKSSNRVYYYNESVAKKVAEYSKRDKTKKSITFFSEKKLIEEAAKKEHKEFAAMYTLVAKDNQICERCGEPAERVIGLGEKQLIFCEKCRQAFVSVASLGRLIQGDETE